MNNVITSDSFISNSFVTELKESFEINSINHTQNILNNLMDKNVKHFAACDAPQEVKDLSNVYNKVQVQNVPEL